MQSIQQNEASAAERRIPFAMIDSSTNTGRDNINFNESSLRISKNGNTPVTAAGSCFQMAAPMSGAYYYQMSQGETDTPGFVTLIVSAASCYSQWPTVMILRAVNVSGGVISVDIKKINDVTVSGVGTSANPWGPA